MAHCTWTYVADNGRQHNIGLFHGKRNAHVMIYVDMKVMQVDFNVRESKRYSFFIEDEFCEIVLERKGDKMFYSFEINKEVDTPRNRDRKKRTKKHWRQTLLMFGGMLAVAILIGVLIQQYKARQEEQLYSAYDNLLWTEATISEVRYPNTDSTRLQYQFSTSSRSETFEMRLTRIPSQAYLPVRAGQTFRVRYDRRHPYRHELYLNRPTESQTAEYVTTVLARHLELHPELDPEVAACRIRTAVDERGLRALALFYYQDVPASENAEYNERIFDVFVNGEKLQRAFMERCW